MASVAIPSSKAGRASSRFAQFLREPLFHFVVLGLLLFGASALVRRNAPPNPQSHQIVLTLDDLRQLEIGFAAQWQRAPAPQEMVALIENRIREEILYREALSLGLDKDDTIVKRRMAQKMEFLAEDVAAAHEPSAAELREWFARNSELFALPPRIRFRHLYFSPDRRGANARVDAERALPRLEGKPADWPGAAALGDPFMFQDSLADRSPEQISKDFGPAFSKALFEQKPGAWRGPIESGYGAHLVYVESLTPGRVPALEEVEPDVKTAWLGAKKAEAWEKAYRQMRAKYELLLPAPPEAGTPSAATTARPAR